MAITGSSRAVEDRTIRDFGEQWTHYGDSDGFYGSPELFADIVSPFLTPADFAGRRVAEIGSGTGYGKTNLPPAGLSAAPAAKASGCWNSAISVMNPP